MFTTDILVKFRFNSYLLIIFQKLTRQIPFLESILVCRHMYPPWNNKLFHINMLNNKISNPSKGIFVGGGCFKKNFPSVILPTSYACKTVKKKPYFTTWYIYEILLKSCRINFILLSADLFQLCLQSMVQYCNFHR